jgi:thioesterase domain-containing protein
MSLPVTLAHDAAYGVDHLRRRLVDEFPLARHMGIDVETANDTTVVLRAPFAPNTNFKSTAFAGSLFSVAVLTGWAWVTRYLASREFLADAVLQESSIRYLVPVRGELRAALHPPRAEAVEKFLRMLDRAGRGRIRLEVEIRDGTTLATHFEGLFVAAIR